MLLIAISAAYVVFGWHSAVRVVHEHDAKAEDYARLDRLETVLVLLLVMVFWPLYWLGVGVWLLYKRETYE